MQNVSWCAAQHPTDLCGEIARLRERVIILEAQLRATSPSPPPLPLFGRALAAEQECERTKQPRTNLLQLLPSDASADVSLHDGRCSRRYAELDEAWSACLAEPHCGGVVRDNGLECPQRQFPRRRRLKLHYELRGGGVAVGSTAAWLCQRRLSALPTGMVASPTAHVAAATSREGYVLIALGSCAMPGYDCVFIRECRSAIRALRRVDRSRPIVVVTDGGIPAKALLGATDADAVHTIPASAIDAGIPVRLPAAALHARVHSQFSH